MSHPSPLPEFDRVAQLEQDLSRLAGVLKSAEWNVGALQWILSLLVVAGVAAVILVRNGVIDLKQVFNQQAIATKVESKGFDFFNRFGKRVMFVEDDKYGVPRLVFLDNNLNYRMGITMSSDSETGDPQLLLIDKVIRGQYRMGKNGEAMLRLLGDQGKGEILMQVTRDGKPSLTMTDTSGKVLFHAPEGTTIPADPTKSSDSRR